MERRLDSQSLWSKLFDYFNYTLLSLIGASIVLPLLNILALSFNGGKDAARGGVYFWPRVFTFANYQEVFLSADILRAYQITIMRTVLGTALSVFLTAMAAYVLKKKTLPGRNFFTMMIFFTMLFNGGIIPYYMLLKNIHLLNTFWVYILPGLYSAWNIIVMRTFFETISTSLEESAKLDGCNDFKIFIKIILPLSKPVIAVIALFNGVGHWNDWFSGAFFVRDKSLYPVQTVLKEMLTTQLKLKELVTSSYHSAELASRLVTGESLKMATIVVATLPIICVYPFIQKYFAEGVMIGAVKG